MNGRRSLLLTAAACALFAVQAAAQDKVPRTNAERDRETAAKEVTEREHEGYSPKGVDLGGFLAFPVLEVKERFSDNVFFDQSRRREDLVTTTNPTLRVRSNWNVHEVEAYASVEDIRYNRFEKENVDNFSGYLSGKLDVTREAYVSGKLSALEGHESRSSPDDAGGVKPTKMRDLTGSMIAEWRGAQMRAKFDANQSRKKFQNARTSTGTLINNHDRNRTELDGGLRLSHQIIPDYFAFVEGRANKRDYVDSHDDNGFQRDSSGYEARIGTSIELSGLLRGDVYANYLWQSYPDPVLEDISAPGAGILLTWTPTPLTTVKGGLARTVGETTTAATAGTLQTRAEGSIAHELQRNILIEADTNYTLSTYDGAGRHDNLLVAGVKTTYKFNRNLYTSFDYHYSRQFNANNSGEYTENAVFAKLGVQY